jgi:hypothetical protein
LKLHAVIEFDYEIPDTAADRILAYGVADPAKCAALDQREGHYSDYLDLADPEYVTFTVTVAPRKPNET